MNISFFYRWDTGSGYIRGRQISLRLDAKRNPKKGFEDDVCIYVKKKPPLDRPEKSYLDVLDGRFLMKWLQDNDINVIAASLASQEYMQKKLGKEVIYLPQHHCNFENEVIPDRGVVTAGVVGRENSLECDMEWLEKELNKHQIKLLYSHYRNDREEVCETIKKLDVQIVWRERAGYEKIRWVRPMFYTSLKLVNAFSFGIPTVARPEVNFKKEFDGKYLEALSPEELVSQVVRLKNDKVLYRDYQQAGIEIARDYHIDKIAERYECLARG